MTWDDHGFGYTDEPWPDSERAQRWRGEEDVPPPYVRPVEARIADLRWCVAWRREAALDCCASYRFDQARVLTAEANAMELEIEGMLL